ncbi:TPA: hypothetical protein N3311_003232, partial [Klebsiella pneumoniae]|nr:hypothetical protein [Klebsiella pneumoniae]
EWDQVLPDLIVFRHHLTPRIQRLPGTVWNGSRVPIDQLIEPLSVIE